MPHKVDMTKALILSLDEWQLEQGESQIVSTVILQVGEFTCVEPDLLLSSFAVQRRSKLWLENAELIIKPIPFIAHCDNCVRDYQPQIGQHYACPTCAAPLHNIRSGRELKIEAVEYEAVERSYVQ